MIATSGVIVGTAALFIILSGFSGLRTFSYSLLDISDPDIKVTPAAGKTFLYNESLKRTIENQTGIADFSKVIEERVFLKSGDKQQIAYVKGVDYNYTNVVKLDSAIQVGNWLHDQYVNTSVIGNGLAFKLSVGAHGFGEPLEILVPKPGTSFINPANSFRSIQTQVIGTYSGTEEFENKFVFVSSLQAQQLLSYDENQFTGIEIKLHPRVDADEFSEQLQQKLGGKYKVQTKMQLNELFYKVINTENFVSYLIFTLILIIAMFNVIGAIIMMIIDKKKNLKTFLNLGATVSEVRNIFVLQGFLLTLFGMFIGLLLALLLVLAQQQFEVFMITSNIAYPVEIKLYNVVIVVSTISILGFLAARIASSRISIQFLES